MLKYLSQFSVLLLILLLSGCSTDTTNKSVEGPYVEEQPLVTQSAKYFGAWKYVHDGSELYIVSTTVLDFEEVDGNQLKVNDAGITKYLIRNGVQNAKIAGKVFSQNISSSTPFKAANRGSGLAGIGGIAVVLKNVLDSTIETTVTTDSDGNFEGDSLPAGTYELTTNHNNTEVITRVTISDEENALGNFFLIKEGVNNFKAELIIPNGFIYADGNEYNATVRIHNISTQNGAGLNFDVIVSDESVNSFVKEINKGTLNAGDYKDQYITLTLDPLTFNEKDIAINIKIIDIAGNQWHDTLPLKVYRAKRKINLLSQDANIRGYITLPNNKQRAIDLSQGFVEVPYLTHGDYYLVLSNPDLSEETAYCIGNDVNATDDLFNNFYITSAYESENFKESNATLVQKGASVSAYLHAGDVDFYKLEISNSSILFSNVKDAINGNLYTSNEITITEEILAYSKLATLSEGNITLNGEDVGPSSLLSLNDKLMIKLTAPSNNAVKVATLYIGELKSDFSIQVGVTDDTIEGGTFVPVQASQTYTYHNSNKFIVNGINTGINVTTSNGTLIKNGVDLEVANTIANNGDEIQVKLQAAKSENKTTSATVKFANESRIYSVSTDTIHGWSVVSPTQTTLYRFTLSSGGGNGHVNVSKDQGSTRSVTFYKDIRKTQAITPNGLTGTYYVEVSAGSGEVRFLFFDNQTSIY